MQWGWEYFKEEKIQREDLYAETISTYDNEHLPREYVKGLEEIYDEKHRQVYMLGKCINLTLGRVYYSFEKVVNTFKMTNINEEKFTDRAENLQVIISFDFNVDPMCAVEIIFDNMNGQLSPAYYQIKDYKVSSSRTDELCDIIIDDIKTRYDFSKTSFIITGDATGARSGTRSEFDDYELIKQKFEDLETNLNKSGIKLNISYIKPSTNPPVRDRVNFVNNLFEKRKLFIEETCKETIEDLNLVSWKKGAEKFSLDKSQKNLTHLSDALGYAVWNTKLFIYNDYLLSDMLTLHRDRWQWGRNFH
jgi:phage terminase large subunit